jgi:hypothetical protein
VWRSLGALLATTSRQIEEESSLKEEDLSLSTDARPEPDFELCFRRGSDIAFLCVTQRDSLTARRRSIASKAMAKNRMERGELPVFMRQKKVLGQSKTAKIEGAVGSRN